MIYESVTHKYLRNAGVKGTVGQ